MCRSSAEHWPTFCAGSQLFLRLAFNCLVSNTDDHDLNHGLVEAERGLSLAPAFDVVPQPSGTQRRSQALLAGPQGANAQRSNLLAAAGAYALAQAQAKRLIDQVKEVVARRWRSCLDQNGIGKQAADLLAPCFVPAYFET